MLNTNDKIISFKNTNYTDISLNNNILEISKSNNPYLDCRFKIVKFNANEIVLKVSKSRILDENSVIHLKNDRQYFNTKKMKALEFSSSICFGKCPSFSLTLTDKNQLKFKGIKYVARKGSFSSIIPDDFKDSLSILINYLDLRSSKIQKSDVPDAQSIYLKLCFQDGTDQIIEGNRDLFDYRIRNLIEYIILYNYEKIKMQREDRYEFNFNNYEWMMNPSAS
jgi:hypothetical protein